MTEVKTQISEEKQTTTAEAELTQTINYLIERQNNINRYSDKLSEALGKLDNAITGINISRDFTFEDTEPFITTKTGNDEEEFTTTEKGYLIIENSYLKIRYYKTTGTYTRKEQWRIYQIPRSERKAIIQSGRLPKFLASVSQKLAEAEHEYKTVSEAAEKMAAALQ